MVSVAESRGRTVVSTSRAKNGQCLVSELNVIIPLPHKNHHFFSIRVRRRKQDYVVIFRILFLILVVSFRLGFVQHTWSQQHLSHRSLIGKHTRMADKTSVEVCQMRLWLLNHTECDQSVVWNNDLVLASLLKWLTPGSWPGQAENDLRTDVASGMFDYSWPWCRVESKCNAASIFCTLSLYFKAAVKSLGITFVSCLEFDKKNDCGWNLFLSALTISRGLALSQLERAWETIHALTSFWLNHFYALYIWVNWSFLSQLQLVQSAAARLLTGKQECIEKKEEKNHSDRDGLFCNQVCGPFAVLILKPNTGVFLDNSFGNDCVIFLHPCDIHFTLENLEEAKWANSRNEWRYLFCQKKHIAL